MHFLGILYLGPQGVLRPEIFTRARDWPRLPSAHPKTGTGVLPKILIVNIKIGPKIQRMRLNNFRVSGSILTGLFPVDVQRGRGDNVGTIFTVPVPKNLWGQKIVQIFSPFLTTFDLDREYLRNGSTYRTSEKNLINRNRFHVGRKKLGELWSTKKKVLEVHKDPPKWTFCGRLKI